MQRCHLHLKSSFTSSCWANTFAQSEIAQGKNINTQIPEFKTAWERIIPTNLQKYQTGPVTSNYPCRMYNVHGAN